MSRPKSSTQHAERMIVIGWDGATWDLLLPWVQSGGLPHLARLMERGVHAKLRSTPLPLSPAAWTSIITGVNPAKHGIFDWFNRRTGSYAVEYVHSGMIAAKPLWQYFNEHGQRVGVMAVPMLYPAVPLDGFMISGMAAPHAHVPHFTFPEGLIHELEARFGPYQVAENEVFRRGGEKAYLQSLLDWLSYQRRLVPYLIESQPCEVYLLVFMQSDHVQHKFWRYLESDWRYDPQRDAPWRNSIYQVYQSLDETLGELMERFGESAHFVLLSDHGAGASYGVMNINRWLHREGYLYLRSGLLHRAKRWMARHEVMPRLARGLAKAGLGKAVRLTSKPMRNRLMSSFLSWDDVDWSRTRAYARGAFGQIYINLKGREPMGMVEPGEAYEALVAEIMAKLGALSHPATGEALITEIHRREEVMHGAHLERAADILFSIQHYSYQTSVQFDVEGDELLSPSEYEDSGGHRPYGILVMAGPQIRSGARLDQADVVDVLPTLLALANLPVPSDLDGRPLSEALTPSKKTKRRTAASSGRGEAGLGNATSSPALNPADEAQLEERLRQLGYLG
jgi:predicted AlkP superfamily phosphohydrolase/phosphomutase